VILMVAGIVGTVLSLIYTLAWSPRREVVRRGRVVVRDPSSESHR
jgi:hypothetical protein